MITSFDIFTNFLQIYAFFLKYNCYKHFLRSNFCQIFLRKHFKNHDIDPRRVDEIKWQLDLFYFAFLQSFKVGQLLQGSWHLTTHASRCADVLVNFMLLQRCHFLTTPTKILQVNVIKQGFLTCTYICKHKKSTNLHANVLSEFFVAWETSANYRRCKKYYKLNPFQNFKVFYQCEITKKKTVMYLLRRSTLANFLLL
jgi:hypothetical protein